MTATSPLTQTGHQIAELQVRIQFLEADKRVQDLLIAKLQSALNFYDGIVLGDGEHDKVMLARDGDIFMRLMKALGMDVSGSDVQEIVDRVEAQRSEIERLREALENMLYIFDRCPASR